MARSLSRANSVAAQLADAVSLLPAFRFYTTRAYSAAASEAATRPTSFARGSSSTAGVVRKVDRTGGMKQDSDAWGPDPVTGFYRPENRGVEIDPAELREMLLNRKVRVPK